LTAPPSTTDEISHDRLRIGVIGAGFISQIAHLYALSRIQEARVVAIAEPHDQLRNEVSRRFEIQEAVSDYRDILNRSDIDALVICVPRRAQSCVVTEALSSSQAVLSEKPMAMTLEEATNMVSIAERSGTTWMVGYMKRYDTGVQHFARQLSSLRASGELGAIIDVTMRDFCGSYGVTPPDHVRRDGPRPIRYPESPHAPDFVAKDLRKDYEYTVNVASHDINLLRLFFGEQISPIALQVTRQGSQRAVFDAGGFTIDLTVAPVDIGRWDQRLDVTFARGRLSLILPSPLARQESASVRIERPGSMHVITIPASENIWSFEAQARTFVEAAKLRAVTVSSGAASLADLAIIVGLWKVVECP
jgi:predicted dehydrogenase